MKIEVSECILRGRQFVGIYAYVNLRCQRSRWQWWKWWFVQYVIRKIQNRPKFRVRNSDSVNDNWKYIAIDFNSNFPEWAPLQQLPKSNFEECSIVSQRIQCIRFVCVCLCVVVVVADGAAAITYNCQMSCCRGEYWVALCLPIEIFDRVRDDTKSKKKILAHTERARECEKCTISHAIGKVKSVHIHFCRHFICCKLCVLVFCFFFISSSYAQI